jgi:hypothetical protein
MPICTCNKGRNANDIFRTSCGLRFQLWPARESPLFPLKFPEELKFPEPPFYITSDIRKSVIPRDILWEYLYQVSLWRMLVLTFLSDLPDREKGNYSNYPYIKLSNSANHEFILRLQNSKQKAGTLEQNLPIEWQHPLYGYGAQQVIFEPGNTSLVEAVIDIFAWRKISYAILLLIDILVKMPLTIEIAITLDNS